jgi:hypothetical protein
MDLRGGGLGPFHSLNSLRPSDRCMFVRDTREYVVEKCYTINEFSSLLPLLFRIRKATASSIGCRLPGIKIFIDFLGHFQDSYLQTGCVLLLLLVFQVVIHSNVTSPIR